MTYIYIASFISSSTNTCVLTRNPLKYQNK